MTDTRVAIIGAGPFGLSLAATLAGRGVPHRIFGRPMQFWRQIADAGGERYLKSFCFGTNLHAPEPGASFADYSRPRGLETFEPCAMRDFADYGRWFQERNVPWVETQDVTGVRRVGDGFGLTLTDGRQLTADNVVVATGLSHFARLPTLFAGLPATHVTHTADMSGFTAFQGKDVAVIGAGQSALEAAALLAEAGARPRLLVREDRIVWHERTPREQSWRRRLRSPITPAGSGPAAWMLWMLPGLVARLPRLLRHRVIVARLDAQGAWWLRGRVEGRVPIELGSSVRAAEVVDGRVRLHVAGPGARTDRVLDVDHVVAGTGYAVDVDRLPFLDAALAQSIARDGRYPRLSLGFESSIPGLYFIGPTSMMRFGPLFRFVVGAEYTARTLSQRFSRVSARSETQSHGPTDLADDIRAAGRGRRRA